MALKDNIVSYWKLDGNSNDSVASNNGTDTSVTYNVGNGKIIQGAGFSAPSTSRIAITSSGLPTGTTFSMQAWWKGTTPVGDGIFGWGSSATTGARRLLLISGGNAYFGGQSSDLNSNFAINDGGWHHIVVTCNANAATIYVDGASKNTGTLALVATDQVTRFGVRTDDSNYVTGAIDEVAVWSRALSATEVIQLYRAGAGFAYPFNTGAFLAFL